MAAVFALVFALRLPFASHAPPDVAADALAPTLPRAAGGEALRAQQDRRGGGGAHQLADYGGGRIATAVSLGGPRPTGAVPPPPSLAPATPVPPGATPAPPADPFAGLTWITTTKDF